MALTLEIPYKKELTSSRSVAELSPLLKDPKDLIEKNFTGLESLTPLSNSTYTWTFQNLSYGGFDLKIRFNTQFISGPNTFEIKPVDITGHRLSSLWKITQQGKGALIHFNMKIILELPVPTLMKGMVQPLAEKELTKLLDQFTENIGKAIA